MRSSRRHTCTRIPLALCAIAAALALESPGALAGPPRQQAAPPPRARVAVGYESARALRVAVKRFPARIVRHIPPLRVAEVQPRRKTRRFIAAVRRLRGIAYVERLAPRVSAAEPALAPNLLLGGAYQWQFAATRANLVPRPVLRAASSVTIAVVDTGADLRAPDLAAKAPSAYSVLTRSANVRDAHGHGTFVASLAAGSATNGDGIAGFGGDAKLLVVQAGRADGSFTDLDEALAIVHAVDRGAKVINLSLGGPSTSSTERMAVEYAARRGALLVAAAGNDYAKGNPAVYPAALLQGPDTQGIGLAVAASTMAGGRAGFSSTGPYVSLAAPGENVFGAVASTSRPGLFPRVTLPGASAGLYGFGSGTSYAAPQVAGAAALVWAANPSLAARDVAAILKETAFGNGAWNPELGFGVMDVADAVAKAQGKLAPVRGVRLRGVKLGRRVLLYWSAAGAVSYRLSVRENRGPTRVVVPATAATSTAFDLVPGRSYAFTVTAVNARGARSVSAPFSVSPAK